MNKMIVLCMVSLWWGRGAMASRTEAEMVDYVKGRLVWYSQESTPPDHVDPNDLGSVEELAAHDRWCAQPKSLRFVFEDAASASNGFSFAENCIAFDYYLGTLGTNDWKTLISQESPPHSGSDPYVEYEAIRGMFILLKDVAYTNAFPCLKAFALNPRGVMRSKAVDLSIELGFVDDSMTSFIETIVTNTVDWSFEDRGASACGGYASKLLTFSPTGIVQQTMKSRAVNMFYRHRKVDVAGAEILDELFVNSLAGYATSSNRLETALYVLNHPDCAAYDRRTFSAITNELLSAGQPLRQLNIGEEGE